MTIPLRRRHAGTALVAALLSMAFGCKAPPEAVGQISGTVTNQGKPLSGCYVQFGDPSRGIFVTAQIDEQGHYEVATAKGRGLRVGTYQVSLLPRHLPPLDDPNPTRFPMPKPTDHPAFPERYRDAKTSGLTTTIAPGDQTFDIIVKP